MKKLLTLALCALFTFHAAEARTLYVNAKRPNNKGNGLKLKTAKKTIQAAINIAKSGDTILVYPGTYAPIKTNNKKITIKTVKGAKKTKIVQPNKSGQQIALAQLGKQYTVYLDTIGTKGKSGILTKGTKSALSGFLLDGMYRPLGSDGELVGVSGGTVKSCTIQRLGNKYADTYGGFPSFAWTTIAANAKLLDCTVKNNRVRKLALEKNDHLNNSHAATTFQRCKIQNNDCESGFGWGTVLYNCLVTGDTVYSEDFFDENTLINCSIAKNIAHTGQWGGENRFSYGSKYNNCILWRNYTTTATTKKTLYGYSYYAANGDYIGFTSVGQTSIYIDVEDADGNWSYQSVPLSNLANYYPGYTTEKQFDYNAIPGKRKKLHNVDTGKDTGNTYKYTDKTNRNPKFTSAYKLKKGSPFINKGKLTSAQKKLVGSKDLAGNKRVNGKAIDRGCYEY